jgi:glycosyltransferase EpsD
MRKVLFTATIDKHIIRFHLPYLEWFKKKGFEVHVAAKGNEEIPFCDVRHTISVERTPFSFNNLRAIRELKAITQKYDFDLVHCHTAMGSVVTRLACREARKRGTKVLYTAHGFHFFKGGSLKNWLLYYPVEKLLSKHADAIITINQEDFKLIKDSGFKTKVHLLESGMGVSTERFYPVDLGTKIELRRKKGYASVAFILIYVAEFIHRKNHQFILDAVEGLAKEIPSLKIIFAGRGQLLEKMKAYAVTKKVDNLVDFLGFRTDVNELMNLADLGISASRQEGLGLNLAEELFCGLPVVATIDRGHREIIIDGYNGFMFEQNNVQCFQEHIVKLYSDKLLYNVMSINATKATEQFSLLRAKGALTGIYQQYI